MSSTICYPPVYPHDRWKKKEFKKALLKTLGIYRTYLYYCYLLGRLPEKIPNHRRPHPAMREESALLGADRSPAASAGVIFAANPGGSGAIHHAEN
ncbi:hypothetical protein [Allofournierella sp. CML151]|uniref:hypothetical protein n=1 Tax=Allofournierella sp. CML151 TaxID=2998082 RepID=UPI0022EAE17B|nr:hypothetical protein [Fournierella sp. CML151]